MRAALLALSLLVLSAGCASTDPVAPGDAVNAAGARIAPPVGSWRLVGFADSDAAVKPEVTLVVEPDGKIAGSGGCNGYFGRWTLGAGQDTLGPVGATRRMCEPEVMDVEDRYFAALARVGGWRPTDAGMVLTGPDGGPLLSFRRE